MGIHVIKMPDIGEGIAEVELVEWHVQPGEAVAEDQVLADVMTDKATVEIPSPVAGTVLALGGKLGQVMAVGSELIRIEVAGAGNVKEAPASAAAGGAAVSSIPASSRRASSWPGRSVRMAASFWRAAAGSFLSRSARAAASAALWRRSASSWRMPARPRSLAGSTASTCS